MRDSPSRLGRLLDLAKTSLAVNMGRVRATVRTHRPHVTGWRTRLLPRLHEREQRDAFWRMARPLLVFGAAYIAAWSYLFIAAFLGATPPPTPLFVPGAVLFAAILLAPPRDWWRYLAVAFVIQVPILAYLHLPPLWNVVGFIPDAIEPIVAVSLMLLFMPLPPRFAGLRVVSVYTGCVAVAVLIAATIGSAVNAGIGGEPYWRSWLTWYLGDSLADLVVAPAIVLWIAAGFGGLRPGSRWRFAEAVLLYGGLLLMGMTVFYARPLDPNAARGLIYLPVPLLLWAAVRFGPRGVATALSLLIVLTIPAVADALGPFASMSVPAAAAFDNVLTLQLFLLVIGVPLFFLAALMQERAAAERTLRDSEARYQTVVETQTEMITRYRPDTTLTFVNDALCRYTGRSREHLLGTSILFTMPEEAAVHVRAMMQGLLAEPKSGITTIEHEAWGLDGTPRWQQWVNRTILDADGQVSEIQGIGRDITDRKQAEEALRASEARYRTVVRNLPHTAVLLFDAQLRHSFADGPGLELVGLTAEGLEGRTVWEAFPEALAAALAPHYEAALSGREVAHDVAYAQHIFHVQAVPMRADLAASASPAASSPSAALAHAGMMVLQDVTEQRRARDDLERERVLSTMFGALSLEFRTLAEHSPDVITRLDPAGRILYVNQSGADLLGLPVDYWIGKTLAELGPPDDVSAPVVQALRAVVATRAPRTFDLETHTASGDQVRALHVRFVPELAEDGTLRSVLGIATDVSALKHAEVRLAEQASELEAIFEAQADVVVVYDQRGRFVRGNRAWEDLFHQHADLRRLASQPEFVGLPVADRVAWLNQQIYDEHGRLIAVEDLPTSRALRGETVTGSTAVDEWYQRADGRGVLLSVSAAPMRDHAGHITGVVVVGRDVTVRRQLGRQLAEQERLFRTLVENSPDIIARFDREQRYLYVNPAIRQVSPLPEAAFLGKTNAELGWPETAYSPAQRAIEQVFVTGQPQTLEQGDAAAVSDDLASTRCFRAQILPERAADGQVASVLTVTTDITALKRTERALRAANAGLETARQEEERRKRIAESLRGVLSMLNSKRASDEVLQYIVRQAEELLGSAAAVIYGPAQGTDNTSQDAQVRVQVAALRVQAAEGLRIGGRPPRPHQRLPFTGAAVEQVLASAQPAALVDARGFPPAGNGVNEGHDADEADGSAEISHLDRELPAPYHALLAVPIRVHDGIYGCLLLFYTQPRRFVVEDVALAQAYADQVAQAITNARVQTQLEQEAAAAERNHLAQELHDTVKQDIFSASLIAESLPAVWQTHRAEAEVGLRQLHTMTQSAMAGLHALLLELRPSALEQMPLGESLRQLAAAMSTRAEVPIAVDMEGAADPEPSLPPPLKVACYRVAQEALMNTTKYARAHAIRVRLRIQGASRLDLEIADDGRGFDPEAIAAGHFGLMIMRERAHSVGANLQVHSHAGQGTQVVMTWRGGRKTLAPARAVQTIGGPS